VGVSGVGSSVLVAVAPAQNRRFDSQDPRLPAFVLEDVSRGRKDVVNGHDLADGLPSPAPSVFQVHP
jgi:hypothetical protein